MAREYARAGRLLSIDLTRGAIGVLPTADYLPAALGGRALGAALAWDMIRPGMSPFDPESPLMFLAGPLAGTIAPAAGRCTVCALAPQGYPTSWFSRASMGGDMGHHLRGAGYDGLIITGRAPEPVYIWITADQAVIRDAQDLWGAGIMRTQSVLHARHGKGARVAAIGPAGETLSRIASIGLNEGSAAGQCGFGAVMGSKNLKAVAAYGTARPRLANPDAFSRLIKALSREYAEDQRRRSRRRPSSRRPPGKRVPCSKGCLHACAARYEGVRGVIFPAREYEGVMQCVSHRFAGYQDYYWDLGFQAGFELNMIANDWGINHWDVLKGLYPWIGMCHEAGMLPDIGGRPVEIDSPTFWYEVLEAIATRQGPMAEIVADGGRRAIERTGLLPDEGCQLYTGWGYANHWDGRGPHGNDIRYPFWLVSALMWMADTRDPMGSAHGYVQDLTRASPFGLGILDWAQMQALAERLYGDPQAMDPQSDGEGKPEAALFHARRAMLKDSLPVCDRVFPRLVTTTTQDGVPRIEGYEGPDLEAALYRLATGHDVDTGQLERLAEKALALERGEQIRDWRRSRADEQHVLEFFCNTDEQQANPLRGERQRARPDDLERLAQRFYELRDWDPLSGHPTQEALSSLGLDQVRQSLQEAGLLVSSEILPGQERS